MICAGYVARTGRGAYRVIVAKPNEKGALKRSRRRWENNIKMFLKERSGGMGWNNLAQDRDRWRPGVCEGIKFQVY